ncbi:MAG: carboxypeptidase regulatory-like domain-containing protein [Planctomycetes bacterium]|nr:carboxypeptidase regulatory-like domain-containing protein [Planctomycetota bacterium]
MVRDVRILSWGGVAAIAIAVVVGALSWSWFASEAPPPARPAESTPSTAILDPTGPEPVVGVAESERIPIAESEDRGASGAAATVALEGLVRDVHGRAIADATVELWLRRTPKVTSKFEEERLASATSRADGSFTIAVPVAVARIAPERWLVRGRADGFVESSVNVAGAPTPIVVELVRSLRIEGSVRDARTHAPIAHAEVDLFRTELLPVVVATTTCDDDGKFSFDGVGEGSTIGFGVVEPGSTPYHHDFGVVRAAADRAVVDVVVSMPAGTRTTWISVDGVSGEPAPFATWVVEGRTLSTTDARGVGTLNLRSTRAPAGDVGAPGFCSARIRLHPIVAPDPRIVIPFLRACSIRGRASDPAGAPLAGWWIYGSRSATNTARASDWFDPAGFATYTLTSLEGTLTAADGSFELDGLAPGPGEFLLCARPDATKHDTGKLFHALMLDRPGLTVVQDIVADPTAKTGTITGTVQLDGAPAVASIQVTSNTGSISVMSSPTGEFLVPDVPAGECSVHVAAGAATWTKQLIVAPFGAHGCYPRLESRSPTITSGKVVGEDGRPIRGVLVGAGPRAIGGVSKADGTFSCSSYVEPGTPLTLTVRDEFQRVERSDVLAGSSDTVLTVRRLVPLRVRVMVDGDEPPSHVKFEWLDPRASEAGWKFVREIQLGGGAFTTLVPTGTIGLRLTELGSEGRIGVALDVDAEVVAAGGELTIRM